MSNKVGLILKLDGESQYTKALQNIKRETKLFQTELKNLDARFEGNRNSMEALQKKQEVLERQQESYARQIKAAKEGLENAREQYKKQADALDELRKKLKEAEEEQKRMEAAGDTSSEAYKEQTEKVNLLREAVDKQSENLLTASGRVTDWNTKLMQAEGGLEACDRELEKNRQYLDEASKSADGCATSIDGMGREVPQAADDLDKLAGEADDAADSMDDAEDSADKLGLKFKDGLMIAAAEAAMKALEALGRKAVEAAKYVLDVGSSFEAQMSKVKAISSGTTTEMNKLSQKAQEMGRKTKFSASEAGEAMEYMAMAGWKTEDMLEGVEGVMNLAAASGEDLGTTSDIVTDALTGFGKSAKDAGKLADIMAVASSNANTNVSMMGETFKYVTPVAGAMGYSMEDTAEAIGLMANAGIKSSQAGTSLRSIITRLATDAGASSTKLGALGTLTEKLGVEFYNADGTARNLNDVLTDARAVWGNLTEEEQVNYANTIAGKNAMSGWLALMNAAPEDIAKMESALENCDGAAERMAETMQDNLSGKLTIMNSALEGLGIALYDHVSGPLQGAVEFATGVINGITDAITPQKTELQEFSEEIRATNEEIERSIQRAQGTVENAEADVAKMEEYKSFLSDVLGDCEKFNEVDLGGGKTAIVNASGEIVSEGFGAIDAAIQNSEAGLGNFGSDGLASAEILTGDDKGIAKVTTAFNEAGEQIEVTDGLLESFGAEGVTAKETIVTQSGEIEKAFEEIDGSLGEVKESAEQADSAIDNVGGDGMNTANVSEGTEKIVEYFNEAGEKIGEVHEQLVNLEDYDYQKIGDGLGYVSGKEEKVYHITDEFTKFRINKIVQEMSKSLPELAERWDSVHGTLRATNEEIERWFGNAQQQAMQEAINRATAELYDKKAEAMLNSAKALSQAREAMKEFNKEFKTSFEENSLTLDDISEAINHYLEGNYDLLTNDMLKAVEALSTAYDDLEGTQGTISDLDGELNQLQTTIKEMGSAYADEDEQRAEWEEGVKSGTVTAENAEEALSEFIDETEDLADATDELTDEEAELQEAMKKAAEDGIEAQETAMDSLLGKFRETREEIKKDLQDKIDLTTGFVYGEVGEGEEGVTMDTLIGNMETYLDSFQRYKDNMEELAAQVGVTISEGFYEYVLDQGEEYGPQILAMINDLNENGGEGLRQLSAAWEEGMNLSDEVSRSLGDTRFAFELEMNKFGSTVEEFDDLRKSIEKAAARAVEGWEGLDEGTAKELQDAIDTAQQMGAKIPDGLAESIKKGEADPISALSQIQGAMQGTLEAMVKIAEENGVEIPENLKSGINDGTADVVAAYEDIASALGKKNVEFRGVGSEGMSELSGGINDSAGEAAGAAEDAVDESVDAATTAAIRFEQAGQIAPQEFASAVKSKISYGTDAAEKLVKDSATAADGQAAEWQSAGESASAKFAYGIELGRADAERAAAFVAGKAALEVSSHKDDLNIPGYNMSIGMANGIYEGGSEVVKAAVNVAVEAVNSAKNALGIHSPSTVAKKEVAGNWNHGLIDGFLDGKDPVAEAMVSTVEYATGKATDAMVKAVSDGVSKARDILDGFGDPFEFGDITSPYLHGDGDEDVIYALRAGMPEFLPGDYNGSTGRDLYNLVRDRWDELGMDAIVQNQLAYDRGDRSEEVLAALQRAQGTVVGGATLAELDSARNASVGTMTRAIESLQETVDSTARANDLVSMELAVTDATQAVRNLTDVIERWMDSGYSTTDSDYDYFGAQVAEISQRAINQRAKRLAMSMGR